MNLAKAIEIQTAIVQTGQYDGNPDDSDAIKLGIEAAKREQEHRELDIDTRFGLLPGETLE